jgi:hypothetical protein
MDLELGGDAGGNGEATRVGDDGNDVPIRATRQAARAL